jgi:hypothetical protein
MLVESRKVGNQQRPALPVLLRSLRAHPAHKRIVVRVFDALERKIDVELRPVEMVCSRSLDAGKLRDGSVPEPRKVIEGKEMLPAVHEQPEPVLGNVRELNSRSAQSTPRGFHLLVP